MNFPQNKTEAQRILNAVRVGCGGHISVKIIEWCLCLTGDIVVGCDA